VGVGVAAIAVRVARVVVAIPGAARDQALEHLPEVVQEGPLELVREDPERGVQGADDDQPVPDLGPGR
jgi:hypothetical protein